MTLLKKRHENVITNQLRANHWFSNSVCQIEQEELHINELGADRGFFSVAKEAGLVSPEALM